MSIRLFFIFLLSLFTIHSYAETVTLYVTGKTLGRLEQCGCATDIEGGVEARAGFLDEVRKENPGAIVVDIGGFMPLIKEKKKAAFVLSNENEVNKTVGTVNLKAMAFMNYDVVLFSSNDLAYGEDFLKKTIPAKSAVLGLHSASNDGWISPTRIVERKGLKVGFVGARSSSELNAVQKHIAALRDTEGADAVVLLAHEPPPIVQRWLTGYRGPKIDAVVALDFGISVNKVGDTFLTNAPGKGRAIGEIELDVEKGKGVTAARYKRIPMNPRRYTNEAMRQFLTQAYAKAVGELDLGVAKSSGADDSNNGYVGAELCMGCHIEEYEQWKKTRHASAFLDLLEQTRQWVPECASCHVTGFGRKEGFQTFPQNASLVHVQCESCHGPGRRHVDEFGTGEIQCTPSKDLCLQCHTKTFSPKFESMYDLYYKRVVHE